MAKQLFLRATGAIGIFALALFFLGINPFLSIGAGLSVSSPAISVNRTLKGDRLPIADPATAFVPDWQSEFRTTQPQAQMPFGCDAAFSTIFAPATSNVYRRCMT